MLTTLRIAYHNVKMKQSLDQMMYYNEEIVNRFNEVFDELVKTEAELQLTKNTRDLFKEDRDALIQNIRGLIPNSND